MMRRGFDGPRIVSGESDGHSLCEEVAKITGQRSRFAVEMAYLLLINVTFSTVF